MGESNMQIFDSQAFRKALGGFGTGIALIAARDRDGRAHGMIVNSLTSVSLAPPIILWCLATKSGAFSIYTECDAFSVNILAADAEGHVKRYSQPGDRVLPPEEVIEMSTGAPVLASAVASLDCRMRSSQSEGDHQVIFGDVAAFRSRPDADAIGFFRGQFLTFSSGEDA